MKYSIIVPVFNVENYLEKCLDSLVSQDYDNYEIIIVNDGSTDNSQKIIEKYKKKYSEIIKNFNKKNGGLSDARNYGLKYVTGDYILFCDSDDYLDIKLLSSLNDSIENKGYDVVKFLFNIVDEKNNIIRKESSNIEGVVSFEQALTLEYANSACCYAFSSDFWRKNNFKFEKNRVHEDFGLIPLVLLLSNSIYVLNIHGYNYLMRNQSITNGAEKNKRRANDMLYHYDNLLKQVSKYEGDEHNLIIYKSYLANGIINSSKLLSGHDFDEYIDELKKRNVCNNLMTDSLKRKIKKLFLKFDMKLFIKYFSK